MTGVVRNQIAVGDDDVLEQPLDKVAALGNWGRLMRIFRLRWRRPGCPQGKVLFHLVVEDR